MGLTRRGVSEVIIFAWKRSTKNANISAATSSDGEVIDHGDGTYSAYITLKVNKQVHSEEKCDETTEPPI